MPIDKKEARTLAQKFANKMKSKHAGQMMCLAVNGKEHVFGASGWNEFADKLKTEYTATLPWNGKSLVNEKRPFHLCAEANVWLEICGRGKNPKHYTVFAFNDNGIIASPCANCDSWVPGAFGDVYSESPKYEGRTRQRP